MAVTYDIVLSNGLSLAAVPENSINATAASIRLFGRGVTEYGEGTQNNLIAILENFSNSSPPSNPLVGQFWYDSLQGIMKYFNGSAWANIQEPGSGSITNAMISNGAFIEIEKLALGSPGEMIVVDSANIPRYRNISGEIQVAADGQVSITKDSKIQLSGALKGSAIMIGLGDVTIATEFGNSQVTSSNIGTAAVTESKIADNSVSAVKMKADSVTASALADNAVGELKLLNNSVTSPKLGSESVISTKIGPLAVQESHLANISVTTDKLANQSVVSNKIESEVIFGYHLVDDTISGDKIVPGTISNSELGLSSVGSSNIQTGAVGSSEIASGGVESANIAGSAISEYHINSAAISTDKIGNGAVTKDKIATASIDVDKIDHGGTANSPNLFLKFTGSSLVFSEFYNDIPPGSITGDQIASGTITQDNLKLPVSASDYGTLYTIGFSNEVNNQDLALGDDVTMDYGTLVI